MKMDRFKSFFNQLCPDLKSISCTGFLNELEISRHLSKCDLGITPVPQHALGKSGSVAAFLCHGLPVASPIINNQFSNFGIGFFNRICCSAVIENADMKSYNIAWEFALKTISILDTASVANCFLLDINECAAGIHFKKINYGRD